MIVHVWQQALCIWCGIAETKEVGWNSFQGKTIDGEQKHKFLLTIQCGNALPIVFYLAWKTESCAQACRIRLKLLEIHVREFVALLGLILQAIVLDVLYHFLETFREFLEIFLIKENLVLVICEMAV